MKKLAIALAVVLIIGAGAYVATEKHQKTRSKATQSTTAPAKKVTYKAVSACSVFTLSDAKQVLGAATTANATPPADVVTTSVNVSTCLYNNNAAILAARKSATLLVRAAKDSGGAKTNKDQFGSGLPTTAQSVSGYGEAAYWDSTYGQFNVLKDNDWLIISVGAATPASHTEADSEAMAKLVLTHF